MDYAVAKKNLRIDYCYMTMMIIYAGCSSEFVYSLATWQYPLGILLPLGSTIALAYYRKVSFSLPFLLLIAGFTLYFAASTLKFQSLHPRFFMVYIIYFFIAYVIMVVFKQRFFVIYANIVSKLCLIAVFFWIFHVLAAGTLMSIFKTITITGPTEEQLNFFVYTIESPSILQNFPIPRNSGFAWEPGAFATFINLAIFSLLITKKFKVLKEPKFWILLIALLTTMSSTGYSIILIVITFLAYNQKPKFFVALVPVILALIMYASTLPFMSEKMVEVSKYNTEELIYYSRKYGYNYTPQRFESLQIDFIDFKNNPILGVGGHGEARWTNQIGANISTVSGIGSLLSIFGTIGALFFLYHLIKTSINLSKSFGYKGWFFLAIMFILITISYALILTPMVMCFWLFRSDFFSLNDRIRYKAYNYLFATYA